MKFSHEVDEIQPATGRISSKQCEDPHFVSPRHCFTPITPPPVHRIPSCLLPLAFPTHLSTPGATSLTCCTIRSSAGVHWISRLAYTAFIVRWATSRFIGSANITPTSRVESHQQRH